MSRFFWDVCIILLGFLVITTAVFMPDIKCSGYCCRTSSRLGASASGRAPFHALPSEQSLAAVARAKGARSGALTVLGAFHQSLTNLDVKHHATYNMLKLGSQKRYKSRFGLITVNGTKGTAADIYGSVLAAQLLARDTDSLIVLNGADSKESPAFVAWSQLATDGVVHWPTSAVSVHKNQHWIAGTYQKLEPTMSKVLLAIFEARLPELKQTKTVFYATSKEREDEIRAAYSNDRSAKVTNTTSAIHAAVLKVLFPAIKVEVDQEQVQADGALAIETVAFAKEVFYHPM